MELIAHVFSLWFFLHCDVVFQLYFYLFFDKNQWGYAYFGSEVDLGVWPYFRFVGLCFGISILLNGGLRVMIGLGI